VCKPINAMQMRKTTTMVGTARLALILLLLCCTWFADARDANSERGASVPDTKEPDHEVRRTRGLQRRRYRMSNSGRGFSKSKSRKHRRGYYRDYDYDEYGYDEYGYDDYGYNGYYGYGSPVCIPDPYEGLGNSLGNGGLSISISSSSSDSIDWDRGRMRQLRVGNERQLKGMSKSWSKSKSKSKSKSGRYSDPSSAYYGGPPPLYDYGFGFEYGPDGFLRPRCPPGFMYVYFVQWKGQLGS
jgi:hypothetical protein